MSKGKKIGLAIFGIYLLTITVVVIIFGFKRLDNNEFKPQNEFKLETWIDLPGPLDINKGVVYVIAAGILSTFTMVYIARRMQARPNRTQTAIETIYAFVRDDITGGSMDDKMARKWFPFLCTLFLFIWFSNLIGYIPLPTNSAESVDIGGLEVPAFAIYAATANISIPLVLALIVFVSYTYEGIRAKGLIGYFKGLVPEGVSGARGDPALHPRAGLEPDAAALAVGSTLRQHPRRPPDHPVHVGRARRAARAGGARRLPAPGRRRPLPLRTGPGGEPAGVHLRHAQCHLPRRRGRRAPLVKGDHVLSTILSVLAATDDGADAGKAIALGVGGGLGAVGAGVGIGIIFGKVIESVTRQPEMRDEITGIQWLGFALTEACFFYGLVAGLIAFFL